MITTIMARRSSSLGRIRSSVRNGIPNIFLNNHNNHNNNHNNRQSHHVVRTSVRSFASTTRIPDLPILSLPRHFLRDSDPQIYDPSTFQRTDILCEPVTGKPKLSGNHNHNHNNDKYQIEACASTEDSYTVQWKDGVTSTYSKGWVHQTLQQRWNKNHPNTSSTTTSSTTTMSVQPTLWTHMTESKVRSSHSGMSMSFHELIKDESGIYQALKSIYQYGFLLVTDTPIDDRPPPSGMDEEDAVSPAEAGVAALAAALTGGKHKVSSTVSLWEHYQHTRQDPQQSPQKIVLPQGTDGPLRTLFGTVWSTSASHQTVGASIADSAYGHEALPFHTDMTYYKEPPGLQIFTMIQPAVEGGESVFGDGFAIATHLHTHHPQAFDTLSNTRRTYRSIDTTTGWHLEAHGPIIQTSSSTPTTPNTIHEQLVQIRHNDLDRLPDLPPPGLTRTEENEFYENLQEAHAIWDELLGRDEFRLVMALKSGDTAVVANQRCLHARHSFRTSQDLPRSVMGCYASQEDLNSRFRMEGFHVP